MATVRRPSEISDSSRGSSSEDESSDNEVRPIPSSVQEPPKLDIDDDAESPDDDEVDKTVAEMQQVLATIPAFKPLRSNSTRRQESRRGQAKEAQLKQGMCSSVTALSGNRYL